MSARDTLDTDKGRGEEREKKKGKIVTLHRVFFVLTILSFSQNLSKGLREERGKNNKIKHDVSTCLDTV